MHLGRALTPRERLAEMRMRYEERAAIREFDGGQSRVAAERAAWDEVYGSKGARR